VSDATALLSKEVGTKLLMYRNYSVGCVGCCLELKSMPKLGGAFGLCSHNFQHEGISSHANRLECKACAVSTFPPKRGASSVILQGNAKRAPEISSSSLMEVDLQYHTLSFPRFRRMSACLVSIPPTCRHQANTLPESPALRLPPVLEEATSVPRNGSLWR